MTFEARTDRRFIRAAGRSVRHVLASHVAEAAQSSRPRLPVNVALVLDRSGSMGGQKIRLALQAIVDALRMLRPEDRFAVIAYDDRIDVVVESTHATPEAVRNAVGAVERIEARGSTDLCGGWLLGCEQIARHLEPEAATVARCLLMTDGLANQGITDPAEIERHAAALRERGIATSTFGIGVDFNELLLQRMATAGGGHAYHIEVAANIRDALTGEIGEALEVTERDVQLVVHLPAGVSAEVITMHDVRRPLVPGELAVRLGDLVSNQETGVVLSLTFPEGEEGVIARVGFDLQRRDGETRATEVAWTFRSHEDNDRQPRDVEVDRAVATAYAARVRHQATMFNQRGELEEARRAILACVKKIRSYAGADRELLQIARDLESEVETFEGPMSAMDLKHARYASLHLSMMREPSGRARRRPEQP